MQGYPWPWWTEGKKIGHLLFPPKSEPIQDEDLGRQNDARHLAPIESDSQEVQSASPVHGGTGDAEGESGDGGIHQDTKVVSKVGAGYSQGIHAGQDKDGADGEKEAAKNRLVHRGIVGLVFQGHLVDMVSQDSQAEDGDGEEVAAVVGIAEYTSQNVTPILYRTR